jgi:tocopherol O-methyltransferase
VCVCFFFCFFSRLHKKVANALQMPFQNNTFDLTWSLESGEHMPDKKVFVDELFRVTKPGGRVIIVTWCHRDLREGAKLKAKEIRLLQKINRAYYLPEWCSRQTYVEIFQNDHQCTDIKVDDWSDFIAPFWKAVIKSSLNLRSMVGLLRSGFSTLRGAYAMFLMLKGFRMGLIKFALITATKPTVEEI